MAYRMHLVAAVVAVASVAAADEGGFHCPQCNRAAPKAGRCADGTALVPTVASCPSCKLRYPEGATFCREDGARLRSTSRSCPSCSEAVEIGAKFCTKDGTKLAAAGTPDLSHVKAGQDWVFETRTQGMTMNMIYRVTDVSDGKVTYEVVTVIDMGGEKKEMPSGQSMTFPVEPAPEAAEAPANVHTKELPNETIKVGNYSFDCKVSETEVPGQDMVSKVWIPTRPKGVATFPVVIKVETTGASEMVMELVEVREP